MGQSGHFLHLYTHFTRIQKKYNTKFVKRHVAVASEADYAYDETN